MQFKQNIDNLNSPPFSCGFLEVTNMLLLFTTSIYYKAISHENRQANIIYDEMYGSLKGELVSWNSEHLCWLLPFDMIPPGQFVWNFFYGDRLLQFCVFL